MIRLRELPPHEVRQVWEQLARTIEPALVEGFLSLKELERWCSDGRARVALFMEGSTLKGVVVTNPMVYDTHIVLNVIAFAGWDMKAWAQVAHEYLQEVKVKSGAQFIEFVTTRSAMRLLGRFGYKLAFYGMRG